MLLTCAALARLTLPGMPRDTSAMIRRAKREGWSGRARSARGGGVAYPVAYLMKVLPEPAREALLDSLSGIAPSSEPAALPLPVPTPDAACDAQLADWQRACADARAAFLGELDRFAALVGPTRAAGRLVVLARTGSLPPDLLALLPVANARAGTLGARALSVRSLFRWRAAFATGGWRALAPEAPLRQEGLPSWAPMLLRLYRTGSRRSLAAVLEDLSGLLPAGTCPSYGKARRFLLFLSAQDRNRGRYGPNGLLAFAGFKRRSTADQLPLDVVSADGYSLKAEIAHPIHGKPFRPELCAILDTTTRMVIGWSAGLSESAAVTLDAIRHAAERFGSFGIFYSDNGSGFTANALSHETLGLLSRIGAVPKNALPGRAQSRGKIERLQQSLWGRESRRLPTFAGRDHDPEARHRLQRRLNADLKRLGMSLLLPTWPDFLAWAQSAVDAYNSRPHRSLPKVRDKVTGRMRHQSPLECLATFEAQGWARQQLPEAILTDLFRPALERITRRGEVSLPWGRYYAVALVPHTGAAVRVGYDIHDGSKVWVRDQQGRLLAIAEQDANVIPEMPMSAIAHSRIRRVRAAIARLDERREDHLAELGPEPIESSPPLESPLPAALSRLMQEAVNETARGQSKPEDLMGTEAGRERYARALSLQATSERGEDIPPADQAWLRSYRASAEYRTHVSLHAEYGAGLFANPHDCPTEDPQ